MQLLSLAKSAAQVSDVSETKTKSLVDHSWWLKGARSLFTLFRTQLEERILILAENETRDNFLPRVPPLERIE
jgi:hypothetical protein